MSAFVLVAKEFFIKTDVQIVKTLTDKGYSVVRRFEINDWIVIQTDKILSSEIHYRLLKNRYFFITGTPIYKGTDSLSKSIDKIANDIIENQFNFNNIRGSFTILYQDEAGNFCFMTDQSGIHNLYYSTNFKVFSNLFLAVINAIPGKLTLNKYAIAEILLSGRQIGPDTIFNEIRKYEVFTDIHLGSARVIYNKSLLEIEKDANPNLAETVNNQISVLDSYFEDIKYFSDYYGLDTGITGGHDSRMLLALIQKHLKRYSVHSYWRKIEDIELATAKKVAMTAEVDLKIVPVQHYLDMSNEQLSQNMKEAVLYYDGHIRMHCFLIEEYNTLKHRTDILGDMRLGMNGIGGEQYRNEEHMESHRWSLEYFIHFFIGYHIGGRSFTELQFENDFFTYMKNKLTARLNLSNGTKYISRLEVKKYMNEVYVTSLMSSRTNAENQLAHFISPYTDRQVTKASYQALPHLGISFYFQQEMIRRMNTDLASVQSGYGYNFIEGEPLSKKLKYLLKEIMPKNTYQNKLDKTYAKKGNEEFVKLLDKFEIVNDSVNLLRSLKIPMNEYSLTCRPDLMPVYISMGYFLKYLTDNHKI